MGIKGAVLGDIAGSYYEFMDRRNDWQKCELYRKESVFTDDTVQSIAVKVALIEGRKIEDVLYLFCKKYEFVGFGEGIHKWIQNPKDYSGNSYGNGSAMRVSFIGEYAKTLDECEEIAKNSSLCTHNSVEGIKGAVTIAGCVYLAEHGCTKDEILEYALKMYPIDKYEYSVGRALSEYRDNYHFEVAAHKSVPVAIRCFYESEDFLSCLRNVIYINGDTDTIGTMSGGIAESFYGKTLLDEEHIFDTYLDRTLKENLYK